MWEVAIETEPFRAAIAGRDASTGRGCCGSSGSPSRRSPRRCASRAAAGVDLDALEITTCLRRGEIEIATRYEPAGGRTSTRRSRRVVRERHADTLFSEDGSTIDEQVAGLLRSSAR